MIYAVVMDGGGYLIAPLVTSGGISRLVMGGEAALINTSPIGWIGRAITGKSIRKTLLVPISQRDFLLIMRLP